MSRCFPYPPPGYMKYGSGKALIESIELKRESEKAKKESHKKESHKKERKREKKEKKEKVKEKPNQFFTGKDKRCNEGHLLKKTEDETRLEKSDVTEEHEQPACYLSDGTQNSNKRKFCTLISNGNHNHGNIIRIRLPKRDDTAYVAKETATPNRPVSCSTSSGTTERDRARTAHVAKEATTSNGLVSCSTSSVLTERDIARTARVAKEATTSNGRVSCSTSSVMTERDSARTARVAKETTIADGRVSCSTTSGMNERDSARTTCVAKGTTTANGRASCSASSGMTEGDSARIALLSKTFESGLQPQCKVETEESLYKTLFENWVPIPIQNVLTDFDDQQWLFKTKKQDGQVAKRSKVSNDVSSSWNYTLGPRACYLPEADIYALPYTIPF